MQWKNRTFESTHKNRALYCCCRTDLHLRHFNSVAIGIVYKNALLPHFAQFVVVAPSRKTYARLRTSSFAIKVAYKFKVSENIESRAGSQVECMNESSQK